MPIKRKTRYNLLHICIHMQQSSSWRARSILSCTPGVAQSDGLAPSFLHANSNSHSDSRQSLSRLVHTRSVIRPAQVRLAEGKRGRAAMAARSAEHEGEESTVGRDRGTFGPRASARPGQWTWQLIAMPITKSQFGLFPLHRLWLNHVHIPWQRGISRRGV